MIELTVFFCSDVSIHTFNDRQFNREISWESDLISGFEWRTVGSGVRRPLSDLRWRPQFDLYRALVAGGFDRIWVHGYGYASAWLAAAAAKATGARLLLREDQTLLRPRSAWKRAGKRVALKALLNGAAGLYVGTESRRYFEHYGVADGDLYWTPHSVDNAYFASCAGRLAPQRSVLRARLGITDQAPVVLFVGKLIPVKEPFLLVDAFARLRRAADAWLVLAGDGLLADAVDQAIAKRSLDRVIRTGFVNQSELPTLYAAADILALPSASETWGLVVNEAFNFSLPAVVTERVGCAADLVRHGETGFVVPVGDVEALAARLHQLVADADLRGALGMRGREVIGSYSIERTADGIVEACLSHGPTSA